ncbi:MAG TPA: SDR family NAD(P)-dependent oxidoreductase [Candidatus Limnocylindria bacterium]|nr:SDR family NAD(P)-dependent oxidoreductase [Candidatus Limnocylindria bacterium]
MLDLSGRAAVVTGATGHLGRTVVRMLLERGAHVALPVRDAAKGETLRASLGDLAAGPDGPRVLVDTVDIADRAAMDAFVERILRAWGRLDILVNLAGGFASGSSLDPGTLETLWSQNVRTTVSATAACVRPMRARGRGRIVTVGAYAAITKARRNGAPYAMAKGALVKWSEGLAEELKGEGITANVVLPSTIDNVENRAAMPKADPRTWVAPDELAAVILFLCSDEASGVTGAAIPVTART